MLRVVRAFFVWALVVALPLQGLAASAMIACGASHERMMARLVPDASAPDVEPMHHAAHAGADSASPCAGADADNEAGPLSHHQGAFSCSACAACCAMAALPAGFAVPPVVAAAQRVQGAPPALRASPLPDALDRPPRTARA
jgi:hypothetical protein